jgi:hypothetical protein
MKESGHYYAADCRELIEQAEKIKVEAEQFLMK